MVTLAVMITSALKHRIVKIFCLLGLLVTASTANAQQMLQLKDVAKIEFITKGHAFSRFYKCYTLKCYNGEWKCYRTFDRNEDEKIPVNSDSVFQAKISKRDVKALLEKIAGINVKKDSINLPKPGKHLLGKYVDSISKKGNYSLSFQKRTQHINEGRTKQFYKKSAERAIYGLKHSWLNDFILVTTKSRDTIKLTGNDGGVYHTPWWINGSKDYGKTVGRVFNKATGATEDAEINKYYSEVYEFLYFKMFQDRYGKEKFKEVSAVREISLLGSFDPQ